MKKLTMYIISAIILCSSFSMQVSAKEILLTEKVEVKQEVLVLVRAEIIETKYRLHEGLIQYRRWNSTYGYWVDDDWITL